MLSPRDFITNHSRISFAPSCCRVKPCSDLCRTAGSIMEQGPMSLFTVSYSMDTPNVFFSTLVLSSTLRFSKHTPRAGNHRTLSVKLLLKLCQTACYKNDHTFRLQTPGSFPASHRPAFTTPLFYQRLRKKKPSTIYRLEGTFFPQNDHLQNCIWDIIRNETQQKTKYQQVSVLKLLGRSQR